MAKKGADDQAGGGHWVATDETRLFGDQSEAFVLAPDADTAAAETFVSLTLDDLLPDDAGEVVLLAGDDLPINLLTGEMLAETGIAPEHVTAGGVEVTGLHYYSFESGLTIYSPVDLLIIDDPNAVG